MECVEAALKTGSRKDMVLMKLRPQAFSDDLLALNAHQNATSNNDDDFVDDLLDFSNNDVFPEELEGEEDEEEEQEDIVNDQRKQKQQQEGGGAAAANDVVSVSLEQKDDFGLVPHFPADDLADLEWLSHFVEDSFSQFTDPLSAGALQQKPPSRLEPETLSSGSERLSFKTQVPSKARSKRSRTGGRVWSLSRISLTEPSSCSSSSTTSSSPTSPWSEPTEPETKPPVKKQEQKKRPAAASEVLRSAPFGPVVQPPRRCSHCGVQKTPQWRAGPHGAKTLCNACGVRFKSGRLYPEYRPACSPTFCSELHSNHHRKVMEMRRKKESLGQP